MINAKHNKVQFILFSAFLATWVVPCWAQLLDEGSVIKKVDSANLEYSIARERRSVKSRSGNTSKKGSIDILRDKNGKILWQKPLPGEIEGIEVVEGRPSVVVKVYSSNRKVRFDQSGKVTRVGDKFPRQITLKNEFSGRSGPQNPVQIVDNATGKVLWELASADVALDCISEDGQYFVLFDSTFTYKKETLERVAQIHKFIADNAEAIKQGKVAEPSYEFSDKDIEKREHLLTLYDVNHKVVWKKAIKQLGQHTAPCCPVIETKNNEIFIFLYEQNPKDMNKRVRRKFNVKGDEIVTEEMGK